MGVAQGAILNSLTPLFPVADASGAVLFSRIGDFLSDQGLPPTPVNYAFAHTVVSGSEPALTIEIASRTYGKVRLTQRDFAELGISIDTEAADPNVVAERRDTELLAAQAQMQMEGFVGMVHAMHCHTRDFGRDLAASADALDGLPVPADDLSRIARAMVVRLREAEVELDQAHREAEELRSALAAARGDALSDPLTGLPNRRALEQAFGERIAAGKLPSVAICDVDHFKRVNDQFGHAVGDRVLRGFAVALSGACEGQFVARYGGEEFAILFDGPPLAAISTLEEARRVISGKRFRLRDSKAVIGRITFSTGVSSTVASDTLASVIDRADALLYEAKTAGRDCIFSDGDIAD